MGRGRHQDNVCAWGLAGDMITYLNVWRAWTDHGRSGAWAYRHFVSHKALLRAEDIRVRLRAQLKHLGEPLATCGTDPGPVCKVRPPVRSLCSSCLRARQRHAVLCAVPIRTDLQGHRPTRSRA